MVEACECACVLESKERMCVCHLPNDILQTIMRHLSILDYIKCRAVSKCWRSAFLLSSEKAYFSQAHQRQPWFLVLDTNDSLEDTEFFRATSKLGNMADKGTIYDSDMPELHGTYVLLSRYGWLLLYSSRCLFFFHMFSRTRINIPYVNVAEMWDPVFQITAPPTSPSCVLFSIASCGISDQYLEYKRWSCKDLSWNSAAFKSFVFQRLDFVLGVNDDKDCSVINLANGSGKSASENESVKAILVEPTRFSLPAT